MDRRGTHAVYHEGMRMHVLAAIVITCVIAVETQAGAAQSQERKGTNKTLKLSGCVEGTDASADRFMLSDSKRRTMYRLTGTNMRAYVGQRVEVVGGLISRRVRIAGGLVPSPNAAAQAGAIDPTRSAMAAAGNAAGTGIGELPEFRVKSVRALPGSCLP